jgi:hypothetical protein
LLPEKTENLTAELSALVFFLTTWREKKYHAKTLRILVFYFFYAAWREKNVTQRFRKDV